MAGENADQAIVLEATTWQELAEILPRGIELMKLQGSYNVYGYASLINDHKKDIKPDNSLSAALYPNTDARLPGMEVAMNVIATGPVEWVATTDREAGIVNTGLWAGIETALQPDGYTDGLNIALDESEIISGADGELMGIAAFIKRELNLPPDGVSIPDLFDPNSEGSKKLQAAEKPTPLGMYKFQFVRTNENGQEKIAVLVSTNHQSPIAKLGLTPIQAAAYILDGYGINRIYNKGTFGCPNWDYFQRAMQSVRERGYAAPRMEAIENAVFRLAHFHKQWAEIEDRTDIDQKDKNALVQQARDDWDVHGEFSELVPEGLQSFDRGDPVKNRDEFIEAGLPLNKEQKIAYFRSQQFPISGEEKIRHNAKIFENGTFDTRYTKKLSAETAADLKTVNGVFGELEKTLSNEGADLKDRAKIMPLKACVGKLLQAMDLPTTSTAEQRQQQARENLTAKLEQLGLRRDKAEAAANTVAEQLAGVQGAKRTVG